MSAVKGDFSSKWAFVISTVDRSEAVRKDMEQFANWFMKNIQYEGAQIGHDFNYEENPAIIVQTEVDNFNSCVDAYQKIQKSHPQVVLVIHVLPKMNSSEYEWMKSLAQRYSFLRQGILFDNAVKRFENLELSVESVFRNMCQWIYRSGLTMVRGEGYTCGLLVGRDLQPTVEKVLYNTEDIHEAVMKVLHKEDEPRGNDAECSVRISGYPDILNSFGIAQLLAPFRVLGVSINGPSDAVVMLENKFQAYQAVRQFDKKELSRNDTLRVWAMGANVNAKLQSV